MIVTGSNIPTSEEVGPNPVDTYRTEDIEKLGVRNTTDLLTKLPQEMGSTINQNIASGATEKQIAREQAELEKKQAELERKSAELQQREAVCCPPSTT